MMHLMSLGAQMLGDDETVKKDEQFTSITPTEKTHARTHQTTHPDLTGDYMLFVREFSYGIRSVL